MERAAVVEPFQPNREAGNWYEVGTDRSMLRLFVSQKYTAKSPQNKAFTPYLSEIYSMNMIIRQKNHDVPYREDLQIENGFWFNFNPISNPVKNEGGATNREAQPKILDSK